MPGKRKDQMDRTALESRVDAALGELHIGRDLAATVLELLEPLKEWHLPTYEHSLRVGLISREIAVVTGADQCAMLLAGLTHDIGKQDVPLAVLDCQTAWTDWHQRQIRKHVMTGYRRLRERGLDFTASVMVWHHKFQRNPYPRVMPAPPAHFTPQTLQIANAYGRLLALADSYDALHRVNSKHDFQQLSDEQIHELMLQGNEDLRLLVDELYEEGVFIG